jgi:CelD/BcsL family acetyltransferase involved in cellulose biosynthesis
MGDGTFETDHVAILAPGARGRMVVDQLVDSLDSLRWDLAVLGPVPRDSLTAQSLRDWTRRKRLPNEERMSSCPVADLPGSFDELLARMPSRFRTSLRSSRRKLAQKYVVEFGLHEEASELPGALETLFRNHASRWAAKDGDGVFVDPRRRHFYDLLARRLRERGWLFFFHLKLDGRIVAQQFCFGYDGSVFLLQEGFDYAHAKENVGNTLRGYVFEYLIERGYRIYDFLAGESRHKSNWSSAVVEDWRVTAGRRSARGLTAFHGAKLGRRMRDALRSQRPATDETSGTDA